MLKRGKQKYKVDYYMKDIYKEYKKENPVDSDYYLDYAEYSNIIKEGFKTISKLLLDGQRITLPYVLGELSIVKQKNNLKRLKVDYKLTKEHGTTIYFLNDHSRGYYYRFRWAKNKCLVENKKYYSFVPSRANKRTLSALITNKKTDYFTA